MNNIYLIYGEEGILINRTIQEFKDQLQYPDFNFSEYSGDCDERIYDTCIVSPFYEDFRVVVVRGDLFTKGDHKLLEKYISEPVKSTILVFAPEAVDRKRALFKITEKQAKVIHYPRLNEKSLLKFIMDTAHEIGSSIDETIARRIVELSSYLESDEVTLYDIKSSLEKLIRYTGNNNPITLEIVNHVIQKAGDQDVFKYVRYVIRSDKRAMPYLITLIERGVNEMQLAALLIRHYRILLKLKIASGEEIGLSSFMMSAFKADNSSQEEVVHRLESICTYMNDVKAGHVTSMLGLEILTAKLVGLQ